MKTTRPQQLIAKAGSVYLTLILTGIFAHFFVRATIIEPGNAAATAQHILSNDFLLKLGLISDLTFIVSFIFLGLLFYRLFRSTDKHYSRALLAVTLVSSAILSANMLNQVAAHYILGGSSYLNVFSMQQIQALSMFFLDLHNHGIHISYLFFGLWLYPLGYLVMKSNLFPGLWAKFFGGLLLAGFVGYEIDFLSYFLLPDSYENITKIATIPADLGEFSLCIWLIFKGAIRKDKHKVVYSAINKTK